MLDKTFDPKAIEQKHYDRAEKSGAFACDPSSDKKPWTVMMPLPNVTGSLHIGHALNTTIQDILTRYHRMQGRDALWQPGLDHAGIATQMVVERQLDAEGISRRDIGREKFIERVWKWKEESGGTIVNQQRKMGATPDWDRSKFTMQPELYKAVIHAFVRLHKDGLIYRDKRLVNWDPKLKTSISDLEVEQRDQKGSMWHIRYPIEGVTAQEIIVATTRPETMLGDTAVAVHPEDERYKDLIGKYVSLPLTGRLIPIVADEHADPEHGSGAVKITPAHDFNDFEVGKRHDLPMINILNEDATLNENVPEAYQGLDCMTARKKILADLEGMDLLAGEEKIKHSVPYGDRSGVVIEPYLTDQWYLDTPTLAKPAIKAVKDGKTTFHPKQWENMYFDWLENQLPWCISRQLWWGHQIPVWYGPDGHIFVAETEDEAYKESDAFYGESVTLTQDEDVLDTWFSSGLWAFSTLGWPDKTPDLKRYYPGDVLVTGFDIITFWVSRMMMMSLHLMDDVPFKDVYIHALVRDSKGAKMSKSKGNVMDPLELTDKYGADALRFTLTAMAAQGRDIRLAEDRIEGYRNFCTKIWNASRYCEMNECIPPKDFDAAAVKYIPNQWILGELKQAQADIEQAIEGYKFNDAANAAYQFVWKTFCDWYLEFTKPMIQEDSEHKDEIRATTGWILEQIYILLNPIMPFITEELYQAMTGKDNLIMAQSWPNYDALPDSTQAKTEMDWLIAGISEIRSVRADMNVPAGAKIQLLVKDASEQTQANLKAYDEILKRMARLESIEVTSEAPKGSIQTILGEATLILPIADIIDLDAEKARLQKQIEKLDKDIQGIEKKLSNEKFVANAPADIIEEQKLRKSTAQETRQKLEAALEQLKVA
ncbi:valine--tRNA ligase [Alphaproteobacteria bacterium]|nr:valine--tRNA ligase [Alphaproteobacteria bacterium]